jgi:LacI family transcriptional regulator, repressor for deo operon, udp, cdd, tsx, nupC, and nupG
MATISEVSKLAGVSVATVSRTLTMPEKVSAKTQIKVHDAVKKTNYKPNILARNFRTRKASTIVVLVPDIANIFFSRVIRGIEKTAMDMGYSVLIGDTQWLAEREYIYSNMVKTSQADGIIQLHCRVPFEDNKDLSFPIVNACDCVKDFAMPTIQLDNRAAAKTMTEHLISLGHKRIAVILGPSESTLTEDRFEGYKSAIEESGLTFNSEMISTGDFSIKSGQKAAQELLSKRIKPTAIFCFNDEMAFGAIHHIKKAGFSVPDDISVVGFDDISFAEYCDPPLTTISQPAEEFGAKAMLMLYNILQNNELTVKDQLLPFEIIIRESSGPAKS